MRERLLVALFCGVVPLQELCAASAALQVEALEVNGRTAPLGISHEGVSFGWSLAASGRGVSQSAYQVRVGFAPEGSEVWDSGKVSSSSQVEVRPGAGIRFREATRYHWQVRVWDQADGVSEWSEAAWFETGLAAGNGWGSARWIGAESAGKSDEALPLLRFEFVEEREVISARLYASALGLYEASLNGRRVGDHYLAPGWTDYAQRIQTQTYAVTDLLQRGANVLGVALADGWYRGKVGLGWSEVYGSQLAFVARLRLEFADGSVRWVESGPEWRTAPGPFLRADLQDGETYDARRLPAGWDMPGFDASSWQAVAVVEGVSGKLVPQPDAPIREVGRRVAVSRTELEPGKFIYDFGQNLVGVVRVRLVGRQGQEVTLRHAEELYRTGPRKGQLYTENLRSAQATDRLLFGAEGAFTYQPRFTQHGFRYVELSGLETSPELAEVEAVVLASDLADIGTLETSHPMLNQLVSNIRWGQRGNFLSIPTDTPARDERLGWTGDISVFSPTAARLQDTRAFLSKWMADVRDVQRLDGNIPAVVPQPRREFDETGVGWSDAIVTVPHSVWWATGDASIVRENWETMKRFYAFVVQSATSDGDLLEQGRASWFSGDWLTLEKVDRLVEHPVIATAYFADLSSRMAELASWLGEDALAIECADRAASIREAFVAAYVSETGIVHPGTQTAYALALGLGLVEDADLSDLVAKRFTEKLGADGNHLRTGFLGTPWLLPALTAIGREDLAMQLLLNTTYPSWGFPISLGATTMWERWNSIQPDGTFGPVDMNSFNHYAYGAVGDWMFARIGGIVALEPGYRRVRIDPMIGAGGLTHAKVSQRTPRGLVAAEWTVGEEGVSLAVRIPVGSEAQVWLDAKDADAVLEGGLPLTKAPGVKRVVREEGRLRMEVGSGEYRFTVGVQ